MAVTDTHSVVQQRRGGLRLGSLVLLVGCVMLTLLVGRSAAADPPAGCTTTAGVTTCVFAFTGASQQWTVPAGVSSATFDVSGAAGGEGPGLNQGTLAGRGGQATATFNVSAGQVFEIVVGGKGGDDSLIHGGNGAGGFNGGAAAGNPTFSGGGGGGSDVRAGACASTSSCGFSDRLIVAGGGGGSGNVAPVGDGGDGGGLTGNAGGGSDPGAGGTQASGGAGGTGAGSGVLGNGGAGAGQSGGGGGGLYGGGGGAGTQFGSSGGGGGSGFGPAGVSFQTGVRSGNGLITISYTSVDAQLSSLLAAVTGVGPGTSLADKVKQVQAYVAANNLPAACSTLNDFINLVKAQTGKKLTPAQAASFTAQANAIKTTLGC